jgi:hypothetical protein
VWIGPLCPDRSRFHERCIGRCWGQSLAAEGTLWWYSLTGGVSTLSWQPQLEQEVVYQHELSVQRDSLWSVGTRAFIILS